MSKVSSPPILNRESMPDAPEGEWFDKVLDYSNGFNDQVAKALRNGVTLYDNTPYKTQSYILKHGVETEIVPPLARGLSCKGVSVLQCEGVEVDSTTQKPTGKVYSLGLGSPIMWRPSGKETGSIYITANFGGTIGEEVRSAIPVASAVTLTLNTTADITSIPLNAGTWDISGVVSFIAAAITGARLTASVNTAALTLGTIGDNRVDTPTVPTANSSLSMCIPQWRVVTSTAITAYLSCNANFSAGTLTACGRISAVRIKIDPATTGRLNLLFYGE